MKYEKYRERMERASARLDSIGAQLWLIVTSERSDPCLPIVTGVHTVGPGAFAITADGRRIALCSKIDAQDIQESGLFDPVITYTDGLGPALAALVDSLKPSNIALNWSKTDPLHDGLTLGRFRWLEKTLAPVFSGGYVPAEALFPEAAGE